MIKASPKLLSVWSLPMRVIQTNPFKTIATLRCLVTGYTISAHVDRVQFIKKPITLALLNDWGHVISNEGSIYSQLLSTDKSQRRPELMGLPGVVSRGQIVGINSQTQQTPDVAKGETNTSNDEELVIYIDEIDEKGCQPELEKVENPAVVGGRKEAPTTKDKDGYDLGASCSNQRNNTSRPPKSRGPKRKHW